MSSKNESHVCCKCKKEYEWLHSFGGYGLYKFADQTKEYCEECYEKEAKKLENIFMKWYKKENI